MDPAPRPTAYSMKVDASTAGGRAGQEGQGRAREERDQGAGERHNRGRHRAVVCVDARSAGRRGGRRGEAWLEGEKLFNDAVQERSIICRALTGPGELLEARNGPH